MMSHDAMNNRVRAIAFYLPQFHPIPENDAWWEKGFTEWTNVVKARPLFKGHYQPQLPADLGFYDLRVPEVREAQAAMARQFGIEGFCYWHYWFHGRRLLERPFGEVLSSGQPDFPFCLAWANESWSRRWSGEDADILLQQTYSDEDDHEHAKWLATAFADSRYLRTKGRPLFLIYRPDRHPALASFLKVLRNTCLNREVPEPLVLGSDAHCPGVDARQFGCDSTLHAAPNLSALPLCFDETQPWLRLRRNLRFGLLSRFKRIYTYDEAMTRMWDATPAHEHYPSFFVGWDNTARRGGESIVVTNSTPDRVYHWLTRYLAVHAKSPETDGVIFLNAWNEWAEGMHLEPDQRYRHAFLEAVSAAIRSQGSGRLEA